MTYRITQPGLAVPACGAFATAQTNAPNYPRLTAAPGDTVMGTYTENGHISKLPVANGSSGMTYWYGTSQYDPSTTLADVVNWTSAGTGGNGKGQLLATTPFDDGVCVEPNGSPIAVQRGGTAAGPCKSSFQLPENVKSGSPYTVYWVWNFSGQWGYVEPRTEWYTSCMDIDISNGTASNGSVSTAEFVGGSGATAKAVDNSGSTAGADDNTVVLTEVNDDSESTTGTDSNSADVTGRPLVASAKFRLRR